MCWKTYRRETEENDSDHSMTHSKCGTLRLIEHVWVQSSAEPRAVSSHPSVMKLFVHLLWPASGQTVAQVKACSLPPEQVWVLWDPGPSQARPGPRQGAAWPAFHTPYRCTRMEVLVNEEALLNAYCDSRHPQILEKTSCSGGNGFREGFVESWGQ